MKKLLLLLLPLCLGALVLNAVPSTDPADPAYDPTGDFDGDGFTNDQENAAGTDPDNADDNPETANPEENDGTLDGEGTENPEEVGNRTPVVENVTAAQIEGTKPMEIFYDLKVSDNRDCVVTVKWSTDNGNSFPLTATALVGAAGPGVVPGDGLKVTWDMGVDWNNQFTQSGRIKIIASRIPADYNPAGSTETGGTSESGI